MRRLAVPKFYGELVGYAMNTDATDFVLPNPRAASRMCPIGTAARGLVGRSNRHRQHACDRHQQW